MVTYYIDATTDPQHPRLVRRINNGHPTGFNNNLGTAVAFDIESLQLTYDLADGVGNPANVRMVAADLTGTAGVQSGRLLAQPDSQSQHHACRTVANADARHAAVLPQHARDAGEPAQSCVRRSVSMRKCNAVLILNRQTAAEPEKTAWRSSHAHGDDARSVLMVGFVTAIVADQRASGLDRDQTQAYAVSHAGLEQLTSDLSTLFTTDFSPSRPRSTRCRRRRRCPVSSSSRRTARRDITSAFKPDGAAIPRRRSPPAARSRPVRTRGSAGIITPYDITVTARSRGGAEVRMRRTAADGCRSGVSVRHVLGRRPELLRRTELQLRRPRSHQRQSVARAGQRQHADAGRPRHRRWRSVPYPSVERLRTSTSRPHKGRSTSSGRAPTRSGRCAPTEGSLKTNPGSAAERAEVDVAVDWHLRQQHPQRPDRCATAQPAAGVAGRAADRSDSPAGAELQRDTSRAGWSTSSGSSARPACASCCRTPRRPSRACRP